MHLLYMYALVFAAIIVNQDLTSPSRVRSLSCESIIVKVDSTCKETPSVIPLYLRALGVYSDCLAIRFIRL